MKLQITKRVVLFVGLALFGGLYVQMRPISLHDTSCSRESRSLDSLYQGSNSHFLSAGNCDHCHGLDPSGIASIGGEGGDINVVDDWSSTMMANSAKDPFWRAKVSHEVFTNPALQAEIEGTCTRCHAPLGRFASIMDGVTDYSINDMLGDSVALDGVSCLACHRQAPQPEIALHTGQLLFENTLVAYGPYVNPLISPMAESSGYIPTLATHISESKLCAACHSLVTQTVDLSGNLTGDEFVEQATWHEWLNSSYPTQNTTCQTCHLPKLEGQNIILAAGYATPGRPFFSLHTLAGGNTLMLGLLRDHREELDIFASESQFNETINATEVQLKNNSLTLDLLNESRTADTLFLDVKLKNITGHKLPSGYPARRMSLHFVVTDENGNEIFRSGGFDGNYALPQENFPMEPHYDIIRNEDDVQIYEMVMGDVNNDRTTVLTRGYSHLKDNRLVPLGFTQSSNVYDTTEVILGIEDADFNFDPAEGSGTDIVHYHVPMNGYYGAAEVHVEMYYQSLPPVWLTDILAVNTPEISAFSSMFDTADKSPVLMKSKNLSIDPYIYVSENKRSPEVIMIKEMNGQVRAKIHKAMTMNAYDLNGKLVLQKRLNPGTCEFSQDLAAGSYLILFETSGGESQVEKVVIH